MCVCVCVCVCVCSVCVLDIFVFTGVRIVRQLEDVVRGLYSVGYIIYSNDFHFHYTARVLLSCIQHVVVAVAGCPAVLSLPVLSEAGSVVVLRGERSCLQEDVLSTSPSSPSQSSGVCTFNSVTNTSQTSSLSLARPSSSLVLIVFIFRQTFVSALSAIRQGESRQHSAPLGM